MAPEGSRLRSLSAKTNTEKPLGLRTSVATVELRPCLTASLLGEYGPPAGRSVEVENAPDARSLWMAQSLQKLGDDNFGGPPPSQSGARLGA